MWTKLLESLRLAKYLISVAANLRLHWTQWKKKLLSLLLTLQILLALSYLGQDNVVGLLLFIMQSKLWCYTFCDKVTERDIIQKNLVFCQTIFIIVCTQSALSYSAVYHSLHSRTSLVRLVFLGYRSLKA